MWSFKKLLIYEKFKIHRKHCRMKRNLINHLINLFIHLVLICVIDAQSIKQTNLKQASPNSKSLASPIKNAYTVYPQIESFLNGDAQIPCNISHPQDDTLLMILVYYNTLSTRSNTSKPIALTSGPPIFSLDLRVHSQYIHRYLHQNKFTDKFKHHLTKRNNNLFDFNQTTNSPQMLNYKNSSLLDSNDLKSDVFSKDVSVKDKLKMNALDTFNSLDSILKRKSRDLNLDDKKANELLNSAQFISPAYNGRLTFNFSTNREQFILKLAKLKEQDAGEYVCRIDFKWTRTLISVVNLFVIVPPNNLYIETEQGIRLSNRIQHKEGDSLILNCVAVEGKPLAKVFWYLDHELIDDTYNQDNTTGHTLNQLIINDLRRKYDSATLTCRAVNHPDLPPLITTLSIQLYLKPRQVAIISNRTPLRTGKRKEIVCETTGSRPSADIRWILGKEKLTDFKNNVSPDATRTISTLNLIVNANQDAELLYCIAENPMFRNSSIIDLWQLEVHYRPKPTLILLDTPLQTKLQQFNVLAGKSTSFKCEVQSNPAIYEIHWLFNGRMVNHEFSIESNGNTSILTINRIDKSHTGVYECMAKNSEGIGRSNLFNLQVNYEPVCLREEIFEANIGDSITINCLIDASPSNCSYLWNIPDLQLLRHSEQTKLHLLNESSLLYKINEQLDYGSIKCLARNEFGKSTCEHFVLPKAKIAPIPKDCELNHTSLNGIPSSYVIICNVPDLPLELLTLNAANTERKFKQLLAKQASIYRETLQETSYFLKIYEEDYNTALFTSQAHEQPFFKLKEHQLHQNATYLFVIYSKNQYGQSPDVILTTQTQRMLRSKINIVNHQMPTLNYQIGDNLVPTMVSAAFIIILCVTLSLKSLLCLTKNLKNSRRLPSNGNIKINDLDANINSTELMLASLNHSDHIKEIEIELPEDTIGSKRCPDVIPLRVDTLDNNYINYNKSMVDCFKKTNLVTFSNQNKIELICSDDDPINITLKNPYETTTYAYNENGNFTLSTTV